MVAYSTEQPWYEIPNKKEIPDGDYARVQRDRATRIVADTAAIEEQQYHWHRLNLWNSMLYTNRQLPAFRWGMPATDSTSMWPVNLRTENLIENIGQTMLAKAASSPLRPTLLPHGASWKTAQAVRTADRFVFGLWRQTGAEDAALQMFNDAYTAGVGCVQVIAGPDNEIFTESVFFDNIVIDDNECGNRAMPKTYRIRKVVPFQSVKHLFKTDACGDEIGMGKKQYATHRAHHPEWVVLIEIWRLPDADGNNGYHAVLTDTHILFEEVWNEKWVPLVFFHWMDRQSGFFPKGGVEQVIPYQVRQNELNDTIEENQRISCVAGLMAPASTQFDWSQWYSEAGRIVLYHGMEPKPLIIPTNLGELLTERQRNKDACYSHMGLNEMFAMGDYAPAVRFDSSAGLREARNMEDARHLRLWTAFEKARLELARTIFRVVARMDKADFKVLYKPFGSSFAGTEVQWGDIKHLVEYEYEWEMAPASLNQMSPAARRETLASRLARGQMMSGQGQDTQMVTHPDLELLERMEMASEEDIERHLDLLESGKFERPSIFTNHVRGQVMVLSNMHRLRRYSDVPEKVLKNHEQWLLDSLVAQKSAMMKQAQGNSFGNGAVPYQPTQGMPGTSAAVGPVS